MSSGSKILMAVLVIGFVAFLAWIAGAFGALVETPQERQQQQQAAEEGPCPKGMEFNQSARYCVV